MKKQKNITSSCCKDGKQVIYFFEKRKQFYLQYEGQDWWAIIKYCPWCGKKLNTDITEEWKPYENQTK